MNKVMLPRLGAACGAVFAVVLFVAAGNGDQHFSAPRAVVGVGAITLAIPFLAYLSRVLGAAEGREGWLATTALVAGVSGISLKLVSTFPELAMHRAHVADGTRLHKALEEISGGATLICLYPLAVCCAAVAIAALRTGVLPRWLGVGAAITAGALAVNGAFLEATFVPALVLFLVWTLATSIHLMRRRPSTAPVGEPSTVTG